MTYTLLALNLLLGLPILVIVARWAERVTINGFDKHADTAINVANDGDPR
jgi:hypothetical protein